MKHFWTKVALPLSLTYKLNVFFLLQCEICQGEIKGTDLSAHPVDCLDMYIHTDIHACIHYKASHKALQVKLVSLGLLIDY